MRSLIGLLKVGKREHLEALRNGIVYCNTLQYFKGLEGSCQGMSDRFECAESVYQFDELSIWKKDRYVPVLKNGFAAWDKGRFRGNIFCTYFINIPMGEVLKAKVYPLNINSSISEFGDSFVIIQNINEFNRRLNRAVKTEGHKLLHGPIQYIDFKSYSGNITPFNKEIRFANQNEFRHYIDREASCKSDVCKYELGSLKDITSEIVEIEALSTLTYFRNNIPTP